MRGTHGFGHAEVGHLHVPVQRDQDVVWRHVAVHDLERVPVVVDQVVRGVQPGGGLRHDARHDARVESATGRRRRSGGLDQVRQRIAVHPLHRDVDDVALVSEVVDLAHVRMTDPRGNARLVHEHSLELGIARKVGKDRLDRDELGEPTLSVEARRPDTRHAADRNRYEELVATETGAAAERIGRALVRIVRSRGGERFCHPAGRLHAPRRDFTFRPTERSSYKNTRCRRRPSEAPSAHGRRGWSPSSPRS